MKFYEKLYWGPDAQKQQKALIKSLKKRKNYLPAMHVITLANDGDNMLDILDAFSLINPVTDDKGLFIIGIAIGRTEALELVRMIIDEAYKALGIVDIKKYLGLD